jgi:hypothetical protein
VTRTSSRRRVWPRAASGGCPRSPTTSDRVSHDALRHRMSRSRDACDRSLPSTASISSTRVSFVLDEVPASRPRNVYFGSATATYSEVDVRAPRGFTPPRRLWWISNDDSTSNHCRACRALAACRLANPFAAVHTSRMRLERCATRSVKTSPFCDPARLPSKGTFHRPPSCDVCRAPWE